MRNAAAGTSRLSVMKQGFRKICGKSVRVQNDYSIVHLVRNPITRNADGLHKVGAKIGGAESGGYAL